MIELTRASETVSGRCAFGEVVVGASVTGVMSPPAFTSQAVVARGAGVVREVGRLHWTVVA
jgi:hypothetical protein